MDQYEVSVAVLTYNPDNEKLLATLRSIIEQRNIRIQIVIADDGSKQVDFAVAEEFFRDNCFSDYVIVKNEVNRGTVCNVYSATERCAGEYIKCISPGDMLNGPDVLRQWIDEMKETGADVSFTDAIYYVPKGDSIETVSCMTHPQDVRCYLDNDSTKARYNYLILQDWFLGAAIVCRRTVQEKYLKEIVGKVRYAEDHIYRLMAYDRVPMHYFPKCGVLYETGVGVSTSGNDFWRQKLKEDYDAANQVLLLRCTGKDPIDKYFKRFVIARNGGRKGKILGFLTIPGLLAHTLKLRLSPRKSSLQ